MNVSYPNLIIQGLASSYHHYGVSKFGHLPQEMQENVSFTLKMQALALSSFSSSFSSLISSCSFFFLLSTQKSFSSVCVCFDRDIQGRESIDLVFLILPMYALTKVLFHYSIVLLSPKPLTLLVVLSCSS